MLFYHHLNIEIIIHRNVFGHAQKIQINLLIHKLEIVFEPALMVNMLTLEIVHVSLVVDSLIYLQIIQLIDVKQLVPLGLSFMLII